MSKRIKVLVSVLVAVVLLTVGSAAAVMADDGSTATENETGRKGLLARVAENLGVTEEELSNAFEQARQEVREEAFIRYLNKAMEKGLITQDEADEIIDWWENRPEALAQLFPRILRAMRGRHMIAVPDNAAEMGRIAQYNADQIKEWREHRPEALGHPLLRARIFKAIRSRQMIAVPNGWDGSRPPALVD